jgi:formylmethanofuran dehydrogenase subunit A
MPEILVDGRRAMTIREAAKVFGYTVKSLQMLVRKGKVEAYRAERTYLVYVDSIAARASRETKRQQVRRWIEEHRAISWTNRAIEDAMHREGFGVELTTIVIVRSEMRRSVGWKYVSSHERMRAGEAI